MESKRVVSSQWSVVSTLPRGMRLVPGLRSLAIAATVALSAGGAWADNVYRMFWTQDFEDADTYNSQLSGNAYINRIFGITADATSATPGGTISQGTRTPYGKAEASKFMLARTSASGSLNSTFTFPEAATVSSDYLLEFDTAIGGPTSSGMAGLAIQTSTGPIATIKVGVGAKDAETSASVYKGDDATTTLATYNTGSRGFDVTTEGNQKYWIHVSVEGIVDDGIYLKIDRADGTAVLAKTKVADTYATITALFFRWTSSNNYSRYAPFDDIILSTPATSAAYTWTGNAGDNLWSTLGNWLVDSAVPTALPVSIDSITIPDDSGEIIVSEDWSWGSISLGANSTVAFYGALASHTLIVPSNWTEDNVFVYGPYTWTVSDGVFTIARVPSTFVRTENGNFSSTALWTVNGKATAVLPGANDTVEFPVKEGGWAITLDADSNCSNLTANADIALTGAKSLYFSGNITGTGKLILDGTYLRGGGRAGATVYIDTDLEVAKSKTAYIQVNGGSNDKQADIYVRGQVLGQGSIIVGPANKRFKGGVHFTTTEPTFKGSITFNKSEYSDNYTYHKVSSPAAFSNATFTVNCSYSDSRYSAPYIFRGLSNSEIHVGALNGNLCARGYDSTTGIRSWINTGYLDIDCTLTGNFSTSRSDDKVISTAGMGFRWMAPTATMHYSLARTAYEEIAGGGVFHIVNTNGLPWVGGRLSFVNKGGTLKTGYDEITVEGETTYVPVDPSAWIQDSTAAIVFDDEGTNRTWATALAASNKGGFVKAGSGTLLLKEAPLYEGETKVKEGVLLVPENTTLTLSSGVKKDGTEEVDGVTYDKYIPFSIASVTVDETTTTFSSVADAARFAATNNNATVVITGEFAATETVVVLPGETLSFTISDANGYSTGKLVVKGADGTVVEASENTYTYTCPKEWLFKDTIAEDLVIDESYFMTGDLYVPKNVSNAEGSLTIQGNSTKFAIDGAVNVAYANYSIGEIDIKDNAEMSMTGLMRVGSNAGTGTVHVASGKLSVGNNFYVADGNSSGTVIVSGGTVDVAGEGRIAPGGNGVGELTVTGGTVNFNSTSSNTSIGYGSNSKGRLNVYGGTINVPNKDLVISANSTGSRGFFDFASGTVTLGKGLKMGGKDGNATTRGYASGIISNTVVLSANELKVGNAKYSDAELTIAGGETTVTTTIDVGANDCVNGLLEMTGGAVTDNGGMNVGRGTTSYGYFKMSGGTLTMNGNASGFQVGFGTSATGVVEVTGGTVTIPNNSNAYFNVPNDSATSTEAAPLCGKVIIGGTGNVTTKHMNIGAQKYSDAYLTVTGGTLTVETKLRVGGKYQDGELDATAVGTYLQTDGAVTAAAFGIGMGGATGTATLSGGTLTVPAITKGTGSATLNLNGGTLKASADSNDFIADGITLNIQEGGIVIDTDGHNVTITQAINTEYPIVKKGTGTLTFSNGDNIDVANITIEAGGVCVTKTTGKIYIGECSLTTDYSVNDSSDWVMDGSLSVNGALYVGNAASVTAQLDVTNATVSAVRVNLDNGDSTSATLNIWKDGKIVTTGTPGVTQYANLLNIGWYGNSNTVNVRGGEIDTLATVNLRNNTISNPLNVTEGGVIKAASLAGGNASLIATFDDGTLVAKYATNEFVTATVNIGAGGMTIESDYAITATSSFSGTGGLTKTGTGALTFTTAPTFSGTITVAENGGSVVVPNTCTVGPGENTIRSIGANNTYVFSYSASTDTLEPGQTDGKTYDTEAAAQTAAAAIAEIAIPSAVSSVVTTDAQITAYKALFSAQAVESATAGKYVVVVDFAPTKKTELEASLTQEFADVDLSSIGSSGGIVTVESPIAGLYYGVLYSTDPANVTTLYGTRTLSDGTTLNLTLPSGDTVQFYKLQVSTTAD